MNLDAYSVKELNHQESKDIDGGFLGAVLAGLSISAFIISQGGDILESFGNSVGEAIMNNASD